MSKEILYHSTRGYGEAFTASRGILQGLAPDGGLFVPDCIPELEKSLEELSEMDYRGVAYEVMKLFLTDFSEQELKDCIEGAYDEKFDISETVALKEAMGAYYLELFHGKTIAFKDMALSILPRFMTAAAAKNGIKDKIVILTATSGDTGKAAMAGFADVEGTAIVVFYPKDGVSHVQERQMVTQKGKNVKVVGIHGNFDDAQTAVKSMFSDSGLEESLKEQGCRFSSANSINIGRLVPQIAYYVYGYTRLLKDGVIKAGEEINIVVPTGNFGNILAAYYGKKMGLPVHKLICASNDNRVLTDFFATGTYDKKREFILTSSPSMDILVSSNLERLIYHIAGNDSERTAALMMSLSKEGEYSIDDAMRDGLVDFYGGYASQDECAARIRKVFEACGYVMDTHTAVASAVYGKYCSETGDEHKTIIASTASPYKFAPSVMEAIEGDSGVDASLQGLERDFAIIDKLEKVSGVSIPAAVTELRDAPVTQNFICEISGMKDEVREFLERL